MTALCGNVTLLYRYHHIDISAVVIVDQCCFVPVESVFYSTVVCQNLEQQINFECFNVYLLKGKQTLTIKLGKY